MRKHKQYFRYNRERSKFVFSKFGNIAKIILKPLQESHSMKINSVLALSTFCRQQREERVQLKKLATSQIERVVFIIYFKSYVQSSAQTKIFKKTEKI